MNDAILLMGGNIGDTKQLLAEACSFVAIQVGHITAQSSLYQTAAWGNTQQQDFINQAIRISTHLSPQELLHAVLHIEKQMGRERKHKWGERTIDIDIIFYNHDSIQQPMLKIPHPHMHERNFVLVPVQEIAPHYMHPVLNRTVSDLLQASTDTLAVEKL